MTSDPRQQEAARTPPHNPDAERAILGCIMLDEKVYPQVARRLDENDFYVHRHRVIYRCIGELVDEDFEIEAIAIIDRLDRQGRLEAAGGESYIVKLSNAVGTTAALKNWTEILLEKSRLRQVAQGLQPIVEGCYSEQLSSHEATEKAAGLVRQVAGANQRQSSDPKDVARQIYRYHEEIVEGAVEKFYECGIAIIDQLCTWDVGKLHLNGSYSGHGKTTITGAVAGSLAKKHDAAVHWWNCEMSQTVQALRILTSLFSDDTTGSPSIREKWAIDPRKVPSDARKRFDSHMIEAIGWLAESAVHIEPPGAIHIRDVELGAEALRMEYPDRPLVVAVDYLGRCVTERGYSIPKSDRVGEASNRLSNLAKRLDAIVIVAAQFTDADYTKQNPIPMPSVKQVRSNKDVHNDADKFFAYHRPWADGAQHSQIAILETGKDRQGLKAHVVMHADGSTNQFNSYPEKLPDPVPGLISRRLNRGFV